MCNGLYEGLSLCRSHLSHILGHSVKLNLEELINKIKNAQSLISTKIKNEEEMYLNMQYYMEYCSKNEYVTPHDWIREHKHY